MFGCSYCLCCETLRLSATSHEVVLYLPVCTVSCAVQLFHQVTKLSSLLHCYRYASHIMAPLLQSYCKLLYYIEAFMFCRPGRGRGAIHVGRPDRLTSRRVHGVVGPNLSADLVACRCCTRSWAQNLSHVLHVYRDELDRMQPNQFFWLPSSCRMLRDYLDALQENELWHAIVPLINFEVVQWYRPDL